MPLRRSCALLEKQLEITIKVNSEYLSSDINWSPEEDSWWTIVAESYSWPQEAEALSVPAPAQQTATTNSSGPAQSVSIIASTFQSCQPIAQPVAGRAVTIGLSLQSVFPTVQSIIGAGTAKTL
jgi:urea transporter